VVVTIMIVVHCGFYTIRRTIIVLRTPIGAREIIRKFVGTRPTRIRTGIRLNLFTRGRIVVVPKCTAAHRYDPSQDFCIRDNDNVGKYCWYTYDSFPCGDWRGVTGLGYDNCGPKCTLIHPGLGTAKMMMLTVSSPSFLLLTVGVVRTTRTAVIPFL